MKKDRFYKNQISQTLNSNAHIDYSIFEISLYDSKKHKLGGHENFIMMNIHKENHVNNSNSKLEVLENGSIGKLLFMNMSIQELVVICGNESGFGKTIDKEESMNCNALERRVDGTKGLK